MSHFCQKGLNIKARDERVNKSLVSELVFLI